MKKTAALLCLLGGCFGNEGEPLADLRAQVEANAALSNNNENRVGRMETAFEFSAEGEATVKAAGRDVVDERDPWATAAVLIMGVVQTLVVGAVIVVAVIALIKARAAKGVAHRALKANGVTP